MGNSMPVPEVMKEYEYNTGQKLLRAIKANSKTQMQECIDVVKEEIRSQNKTSRLAHDKDYENMIKKVTLYLTRGYDIGDGMLFTKTPIQYAEQLKADQAIQFINNTLIELSKIESANKVMEEKGTKVARESSSVGVVDRDRVNQAKERLKAFQNERNNAKK
jgi:hypothetical protein